MLFVNPLLSSLMLMNDLLVTLADSICGDREARCEASTLPRRLWWLQSKVGFASAEPGTS